MSELITDEMVETAARAEAGVSWPSTAWDDLPHDVQVALVDHARAALTAAAPLIAAQALRDAADDIYESRGPRQGVMAAPADLRALLDENEQLRQTLDYYEKRYPCDGGCGYDAPEKVCSRHGLRPTELWQLVDREEGEPAEEYTPITAYLDRVQALTDAATPGPWEWDPPSDANWPIGDENLWSTATDPREPVVTSWGYDADGIEAAPENRAFIAAARTDVEVMTKALRAVTAATEGVELQPEDGPATRGWKSALIQMRSLVEEAIPGE